MIENFFYFVDSVLADNPLLSLPLVFASGVLVSFTPCFYPLVPVVLGIIGIDKEISKREALLLSVTYVLGLSTVYTALGMVSALTGSLFGAFTKLAVFQFVGAAIFLYMGLVLLDIVQLPIHFALNLKPKKAGFFSVFLLGIISGLVVGGCTFPVLSSILALIALEKSVVMGGVLLFVFSLGLGAIFIIVALCEEGFLAALRKKARFFMAVKKILGAGLIVLAMYFIRRGFYLL